MTTERMELRFLPTRTVRWGPGSVAQLATTIHELGGSRVVVMTTSSLGRQAALLDAVIASCGDLHQSTITELPAHVPVGATERAAAHVLEVGADTLVSFGGGSVIDAAKAAAATILDRGLPAPYHVSVPTTLSGSELSHFFGVTEANGDGSFKRSHARVEVTPHAVVYDAELTAATPDRLWLSSGIKALDHAIEAMLGGAPDLLVGTLALTGIRHMADFLERSTMPNALGDRQICQLAGWECYVAPGSLSLGLSHRIGHVLGGTYGVPHSITSAITLAPVMRAMASLAPATLARIADALDPKMPLLVDEPSSTDASAAADRVEALVSRLSLPHRLGDVGIGPEDLPRVAELVTAAYPQAVAQLGDGSEKRLRALLDEMQ